MAKFKKPKPVPFLDVYKDQPIPKFGMTMTVTSPPISSMMKSLEAQILEEVRLAAETGRERVSTLTLTAQKAGAFIIWKYNG